MINIGGGRPGVSDMALLGHPGKFTYCLAEAEEESPLPPLHTSLGFDQSDSVVTLLGCEAPHSVLYSDNADDPEDAEELDGPAEPQEEPPEEKYPAEEEGAHPVTSYRHDPQPVEGSP